MPAFEDNVKLRQLVWTISFGLLFAIPGSAQSQPRPTIPSSQGSQGASPMAGDPMGNGNGDESQQRMMRDMAKKANLERQAALKSDTEKLVKLAQAVKT